MSAAAAARRGSPRLRRALLGLALGLAAAALGFGAYRHLASFRPELAWVRFPLRSGRPGDAFSYVLCFQNGGGPAVEERLKVFVHFERAPGACADTVLYDDHEPLFAPSEWQSGLEAVDGPHVCELPEDMPEGEYYLHVGLASPSLDWLVDEQVGTVRISRDAPLSRRSDPLQLAADDLARRRSALADRTRWSPALESEHWRFEVDLHTGAWALADRATGVLWTSSFERGAAGEVELRRGDEALAVRIDHFDAVNLVDGGLEAGVELHARGRPSGVRFELRAAPLESGGGLRLEWETSAAGDWRVERVSLLDHALAATDADAGTMILPRRAGQMLPCDRGEASHRRYTTYGDITMMMCGAVKQGSALLAAWESPDAELHTHLSIEDLPLVAGRRVRSFSLDVPGTAGALELWPLGPGGYPEIGRAYRAVAERRGHRRTLAEKQAEMPSVERLAGAPQFKMMQLYRARPGTAVNRGDTLIEELHYTFEEVARCAEHWRRDLEIDRALVVLAGWNFAGYDNQLPYVLPACPEAGGNEGLVDCSQRVQALGYAFGLHDNYLDMYPDSPYASEAILNLDRRGDPKVSGAWAGGQAYLICTTQQPAIAQRNLLRIRELCSPTLQYLDAGFNWDLLECDAPAHPMTRRDDLAQRIELCRTVREAIGVLGVEGAPEWAVPYAEYINGLLAPRVSEDTSWSPIPLYELVYGDCAKLYPREDPVDRVGADGAEAFAKLLAWGETPIYKLPRHLYFEREPELAPALAQRPEYALARGDGGWAEHLGPTDRFLKNTFEVASWVERLTWSVPMSDHAFLAGGEESERARFGDLEIMIHRGAEPLDLDGTFLPRFGFLVRSPTFTAFYALRHAGVDYPGGALFTLRSLDGLPLETSADVRVYHGFGPAQVALWGEVHEVAREAVLRR